MPIIYQTDLEAVDWQALKSVLAADDFDNGRDPEQLRISFENSHSTCISYANGDIIGTVRALSDGVCNAYVVDVWTLTAFRGHGIARRMMATLLANLAGQHVYLFTDKETAGFYEANGFEQAGIGYERIVGSWLDAGSELQSDIGEELGD